MSLRSITEGEVAEHDKAKDCWVIIEDAKDKDKVPKVYDVTKYLDDHPGGSEIIVEYAGKDATDMFEDIGHSSEARKKLSELCIGILAIDPNKPRATKKKVEIKSGGGLNPIAVVLLLIAIAVGYYFSQMKK